MSKRSSSKCCRVEVQKGPINMNAQFTNKFKNGYECMVQDIHNNALRQDKMTLTLHVPKQ